MAVTQSYTAPGVYVTETINVPPVVTPATTSLTAVMGLFPKGPTNQAVLVTSWEAFVQEFGGFGAPSTAALTVFQFFQNGGGGAWIVRLGTPTTKQADAQAATATTEATPAVIENPGTVAASGTMGTPTVTGGTLTFTATSPGAWGTNLSVAFVPPANPLAPSGTFDCTISDADANVLERIAGLSMKDLKGAAAQITAESANVGVTAAPTPAGSTAPITLAAAPVAANAGLAPAVKASPAPVVLQGGADGIWNPQLFVQAVQAELGEPVGSAPPATPPLDQIAPAVFNLMAIPDSVWLSVDDQNLILGTAQKFCAARQAFLLIDPPAPPSATADTARKPPWADATAPTVDAIGGPSLTSLTMLLTGAWGSKFLIAANTNVATYYPWLQITDPQTTEPVLAAPSGTIAGIYATTDATRGVWKAPAGVQASLSNVDALADLTITDALDGQLNAAGVNVIRTFLNYGPVVWGARTAAGSTSVAFRYLSVRRLTDFIEQSLLQSLKWAVFEPNGPGLWAALKLETTAFMSTLFGAGAFSGNSAAQAFQVACDATTTSSADMLAGVVNLNVGFTPVEPAEFVVVNVTLNAGSPAGGN